MSSESIRTTGAMRIRYAGKCRTCRVDLVAGALAIYDRDAKSLTCVDCAAEPSSEAPVPVPSSCLIAEYDASGSELVVADSRRNTQPVEVFVGTPGASAQREYERRKNKRESRIRDAHPMMGGLILALSDDPQSTRAWATGARGEELLGTRLNGLTDKGAYLLHDRRIPPTLANIDHMVVCPSGVFVIDAKKYTGRPALRVEGGLFRPRTETLIVGSRDCTKIVGGVQKQIDRVTIALDGAGLGIVRVRGMLCFVEADWPLFGGDFLIDGIHVLWPKKAAEQLMKPGPIDRVTAQNAHRVLASAFPPA
jgi:hypothetical protein